MQSRSRRQVLQFGAGAAVLPAVSSMGWAQAYPSRPMTMIVHYVAGRPSDPVFRPVAERMRNSLGQPIILEFVGGASGAIGVSRALRAAPDGYTISGGDWGSHVANGVIGIGQYDLLKDLEPGQRIASHAQ